MIENRKIASLTPVLVMTPVLVNSVNSLPIISGRSNHSDPGKSSL